jgi:hypothetical protein
MSEEIAGNVEAGAGAPESSDEIARILSMAKEHLATVASLKVEIQTYSDTIKQSRDALAAIVEEAKKDLEASKVVTQALTVAGDKATTDQGLIASKSAQIQEAQSHADKVRAELDKLLTAATTSATNVEAAQTRAVQADEAIKATGGQIKATKAAVDLDAAAVKDALQRSEQSATDTKGLADRAAGIEAALKKYESRLAELDTEAKKQLETITALLPGATSAGLASAFDSRAGTFRGPKRHWQMIFVGSLLSLVALGVTGIWHALTASTVLTYDELIRLWLMRLPVAGALLWLTLHAARETALAKRLEEDYGYKAAIAASFEGFNLQMSKVEGQAAEGSPLRQLCADTLATIASPPGRIYDRHRLTVSPGHEVAALAAALAAALKSNSAPEKSSGD